VYCKEPLWQTNLSEQTMKITKLIEKIAAVALVATAFTLASCEKTVDGMKDDASAAAEATEKAAADAKDKMKDAADTAAEKTEAAVDATKEAAAEAKEAIKETVNEAAKKVGEATAPAAPAPAQ